MILIVAIIIGVLLVVGAVVFELVGWLVERKARARFEKMTPEERFKYQNEMRKKQL
jgi:Zn-dependent membrane protease YugP